MTESKAAKFYKRVVEDDKSVKAMVNDLYTLATLTSAEYTAKYGRKLSFAAAIAPDWMAELPAIPAR